MEGIAVAACFLVCSVLVTPLYFSFIAGVNFDLICRLDLLESVASILFLYTFHCLQIYSTTA